MRQHGLTKILAYLLVLAMVLSLSPAIATADTSVSIESVKDQIARIVVASETGGVDWGNEPIVVTIRSDPVDAELSAVVSPQSLLDASFSGLHGNVLTLTPKDITGIAKVAVTATKDGVSASTSFRVQINKYEDTGEYEWGDMQIPGGGFVTGLIFHPNVPNILYARTDVSGAWRFNFETLEWECITNWIRTGISGSPAQNLAIAIDPDPERAGYVYTAYSSSGTIMRSTDYGETWVRLGNTGGSAAGNSSGRGLGERLVVMPGDGLTMYFAGVSGGLRKSTDGGLTWSGVNLTHGYGRNPDTNETIMGFVNYDPANPDFIVASTAGRNGNPVDSALTRGASVFYSADGGATFQELPFQPLPGRYVTSGSEYYGFMGVRSAFSPPDQDGNRYLFVTYLDTGTSAMSMEGNGVDGCVFRWKIDADGQILDWANITPVRIEETVIRRLAQDLTNIQFGVAFGGVAVDPQIPGALLISTVRAFRPAQADDGYWRPMDTIFRSLDYGETWFPINTGYLMFGDSSPIGEKSPYTRPMMYGQRNRFHPDEPGRWEPWTIMHWVSCVAINPFNSNMGMYNSGMGTFVTYGLTAVDHINAATPHAVPAEGLDPREGLFTQESNVSTGVVESRYEPYRIGNAINDLTADESVKWEAVIGLEMSVAKEGGLYSPPSGDVILHSIFWDHGGFAFTSLTELPDSNYSHNTVIPEEFRHLTNGQELYPTTSWFTGRNASFAALNPDIVVATLSGDNHWNNTGGVAITFDNATVWHQLPDGWPDGEGRIEYTFGIGGGMPTETLQNVVTGLKSPDQNAGHAVVTADGRNVLWSIGNLSIARQVYTEDYGQTWYQCEYYNSEGTPVTSGNTYFVADHVNPDVVYAFMASTTLYVSQDGGKTFNQANTSYNGMSTNGLATINGAREIRPDLDYEGIIYIGGNNLWKLTYDKETNTMSAEQVPSIDTVVRYGAGIGVQVDKGNKALYVYGNRTGTGQQSGYGVWRSLDGGDTWVKITWSTDNPSPAGTEEDPYLNANVQYSDVRSVIGDARTFGRVYVSLGNVSGAVKYGEMITNLVEEGRATYYLPWIQRILAPMP
jgi:hypothetical protein